jgi:hypothetical protein
VRPTLDGGEDPDWWLPAADDASNLICLKLGEGESSRFSIVKPTAQARCLLEPAMDGIPGDALYSSDRRLIQTLNAEGCDFIEGCATVLEPMGKCAGVQTRRLPTSRHRHRRRFPDLVV